MNKNQIAISGIYQNSGKFECFARIENYSNLCKWIAVGENVTSDTFTLLFPDSIGVSVWRLLFYPRGQYVNQIAGDYMGVYLSLLSCDNADKVLMADVTFRLKAQTEIGNDGYLTRRKCEFIYSSPCKRWVAFPKFAPINMPKSRRSAFFVDDSLVICCSIKESHRKSSDNENAFITDDILTKREKGTDFQSSKGITLEGIELSQNGESSSVEPAISEYASSSDAIDLEAGAGCQHRPLNGNEPDEGDHPEQSEWTTASRKKRGGTRGNSLTCARKQASSINPPLKINRPEIRRTTKRNKFQKVIGFFKSFFT